MDSAITFLEPLPAGLVIALVTAGIPGRRRREERVLATTLSKTGDLSRRAGFRTFGGLSMRNDSN